MSEQFDNKDYSAYLSAVEKSLERKQLNSIKTATTNLSQPKKNIRIRWFNLWLYVTAIILIVVILVVTIANFSDRISVSNKDINNTESTAEKSEGVETETKAETETEKAKVNYYAKYTDDTATIASDIISQNIIVINCDTNKVVAARNAKERCYPASTTKIMTVLTAVDYIKDYNDTFTYTYEIIDPFFRQDATLAGFKDKEAVNITDMLYGAILPSGADATAGIAIKIAGSEEKFVELMNKKAKELGLNNTHFTNASGLFDKNHYTTPEDMAIIIREAMKNDLCKKILSTYQYTTTPTPQNPEGILLTSTLFSYMYGTEPEGSDILGGKTGYVNESGYCIASFGKSDKGSEYVCVAFKGTSHYPAVYDQIKLYTRYAK